MIGKSAKSKKDFAVEFHSILDVFGRHRRYNRIKLYSFFVTNIESTEFIGTQSL